MMQLIECVPNFSEGRNPDIIHKIGEAIRSVQDVHLLHVDSNANANRTVMTLVGPPQEIGRAAIRAIETATQLIDMTQHLGEHPRLGSVDVCPFIPLSNTNPEQCVDIARDVAKFVGELGIPVYLYGTAAVHENRQELSSIRKGGYEGLSEKMKMSEWKPDFGPGSFNAKSGAVVIGVRNIMIAYNINLNTKNIQIAKRIARQIRESGYVKDGERIPGQFKACKAIGWLMKGFDCAQVSTNLMDYHISAPHAVFETCQALAIEMGVQVTGSELIGLIPLEAMIDSGEFFLNENHHSIQTEDEIINTAIKGLGLNSLAPFNPFERILEYALINVVR